MLMTDTMYDVMTHEKHWDFERNCCERIMIRPLSSIIYIEISRAFESRLAPLSRDSRGAPIRLSLYIWRSGSYTFVSQRPSKAYFPLGDFIRANRQKSRNASYLFAANFFASQF